MHNQDWVEGLTLSKTASVSPPPSHECNITPEIGGKLTLLGGVPTGRGAVGFFATRIFAITYVGVREATVIEGDKSVCSVNQEKLQETSKPGHDHAKTVDGHEQTILQDGMNAPELVGIRDIDNVVNGWGPPFNVRWECPNADEKNWEQNQNEGKNHRGVAWRKS